MGITYLLAALLLGVLAGTSSQVRAAEDVHIAFLTDCSGYSDWQTVGMAFSYKVTKQPGAITRVMCCTDKERERYNQQLLNLMPTHVAPSFAYNERLNDHYAAYNKPGAVVDWLKHVTPKENWTLVIDSDMLLLKQFQPKDFNLSKGWCVSADYTYLIGVSNDLWKGHIPEVGPRNDTLAGPYGRHADQVGGFFFVHKDDLAKMAPYWLKITEDVRADPEAWRLSGDQYVEKGGRPWISEMYGYVYGAAKMDIWHRWEIHTMHYPTYAPSGKDLEGMARSETDMESGGGNAASGEAHRAHARCNCMPNTLCCDAVTLSLGHAAPGTPLCIKICISSLVMGPEASSSA